jgi:hypothetical protein
MSTPEAESASQPASEPAATDDQAAKLRSAADAVRLAEAELKKAKDCYEKLRTAAAEQIKSARQATLGQIIDGTLAAVRKHPGLGVLLAGLLGYFFGRLFPRK